MDADGVEHRQSGGGIAYDFWDNEHPATDEELMEEISKPEPDVCFLDDGRVIAYFCDQEMDITDKFNGDKCQVHLVNGDDEIFLIVTRNNGCAYSSEKYIDS